MRKLLFCLRSMVYFLKIVFIFANSNFYWIHRDSTKYFTWVIGQHCTCHQSFYIILVLKTDLLILHHTFAWHALWLNYCIFMILFSHTCNKIIPSKLKKKNVNLNLRYYCLIIWRLPLIPVVMGPSDYWKIAPPHSYIDVNDFANIEELANYLIYLGVGVKSKHWDFFSFSQYICKSY